MRVGAKSAAIWAFPLAVLAVALIFAATDLGGVSARLRGVEFDFYQHLKPRPYVDTAARSGFSVRVLDIDAASVARLGRWPWPHTLLATVCSRLKAAGAAIVVLAFPLDAPDPATPAELASLLPNGHQSDAARVALAALPAPDDALAATLRGQRAVTGFVLGGQAAHAPALKANISFAGMSQAPAAVRHFENAAPSLPAIEAASAGVGALNTPADRDGKLRALPMLFRLRDRAVPSLDAEVARLASGAPNIVMRSEENGLPGIGGGTEIGGMSAGAFDAKLRADGALEIYFSGRRDAREISAATLVAGEVAPASLKNAIVYIAAPDASVQTPAGPRNIAEVRAEAMENILLGVPLKPVSTPFPGLIFLLVAGAGMVMLFARANAIWAGALALVAIAAAQGFSWFLFSNSQVLLDSMTPSAALALAFGAGLSARSLEVARARARLKGSFSDQLSGNAIEEIAHAPALLKLEGESRMVTCVSCGVRRYAKLAESFADDPVGFTRLINMAMAPLIDDAVVHGGMVGPYDGETFTAYWNAPLDDSEHAIHACEAANRMTVTLAQVNEQLAHERRFDGTAFEPMEVGIGISTGRAIAGGFTSRGRTSYAVTGDCALLANRIRALSARYGPAIVVSEDTREAASRGFAFLEVDFIACGPRDEPVKLYAMLGNPLVRASPKFRALATFHDHIFQSLRTQQWEKTRELIDQCRKLSGASQKMYDLHLARVAWFEANPPGADWDGAFRQNVN
jgi:adenylate cyclase